jgi:hypothetical protein
VVCDQLCRGVEDFQMAVSIQDVEMKKCLTGPRVLSYTK